MRIPSLTWLEVEVKQYMSEKCISGKIILNKNIQPEKVLLIYCFNYQNNVFLKSVLWFLTD